jgi:tetratricopeptide (TPR) repeat protein
MPKPTDKQCAEDLYWQAIHLSGPQNSDLRKAWLTVEEALGLDPNHVNANVLAGDLRCTESEVLNPELSQVQAAALALPYYERALQAEPRHADAWSGKSCALGHLSRHAEALTAAESGFAVLPLRVGYHWSYEVYRSVAEELYEGKLRALVALGRREEALQTLAEGLSRYPERTYLVEIQAELGLFPVPMGADTA